MTRDDSMVFTAGVFVVLALIMWAACVSVAAGQVDAGMAPVMEDSDGGDEQDGDAIGGGPGAAVPTGAEVGAGRGAAESGRPVAGVREATGGRGGSGGAGSALHGRQHGAGEAGHRGDEPEHLGLTDRLWLARAAVGECGWKKARCHRAVWFALRRRWQEIPSRDPGYTLADLARAYCRALRPDASTTRSTWVQSLGDGDREPVGWPDKASWTNHRLWWLSIYRRAGAFMGGELRDPCRGKPVHFGGPMDVKRVDPSKWRVVVCGDTGKQIFWEAR